MMKSTSSNIVAVVDGVCQGVNDDRVKKGIRDGSGDSVAVRTVGDAAYGYGGSAVGELQQVWGDFLDKVGCDMSGWDWYCTLTFRDPGEKQRRKAPYWTQPGWAYAHQALRCLTGTLLHNRFDAVKAQPYWIALMEMQKWRGVPHWHLLMGNCGDLRRLDWVDWWWQGFGIARILPYRAELGARFYLGKYLTKEIADIKASPQLRECHRRAVASSSQDRG